MPGTRCQEQVPILSSDCSRQPFCCASSSRWLFQWRFRKSWMRGSHPRSNCQMQRFLRTTSRGFRSLELWMKRWWLNLGNRFARLASNSIAYFDDWSGLSCSNQSTPMLLVCRWCAWTSVCGWGVASFLDRQRVVLCFPVGRDWSRLVWFPSDIVCKYPQISWDPESTGNMVPSYQNDYILRLHFLGRFFSFWPPVPLPQLP
jgi:hypothetical protein